MSTPARPCAATTKAGTPCKRPARPGSAYCATHAGLETAPAPSVSQEATVLEAAPAPTVPPEAAPSADETTALRELARELNELAAELQRLVPEYAAPPFSPQALRNLLHHALERLAPGQRLQVLADLRASFEGTSLEDFKDFETWKGLWFTLNYLVTSEASRRKDWLMERLQRLPGIGAAAGLKEMLADTPPEEFLKPETWKGLWFIAHYELQTQAAALKRRLLGGEESA
jgi:hypothetical protein